MYCYKYFGWSVVFLCWVVWVNYAMCMAMTFLLLSIHFVNTVKMLTRTTLWRKPKCKVKFRKTSFEYSQLLIFFRTTEGEILVKTKSVIRLIISKPVFYLYILLFVKYPNWKQSNSKYLKLIKTNILAWLKWYRTHLSANRRDTFSNLVPING